MVVVVVEIQHVDRFPVSHPWFGGLVVWGTLRSLVELGSVASLNLMAYVHLLLVLPYCMMVAVNHHVGVWPFYMGVLLPEYPC